MKKILSIVLAGLMLMGTLASCTTLEEDDKGAIIDMYLATEVLDFDPQNAMTDDAQLYFMSMMFEGLTRLDKNGKWVNAMMSSYKIEEDDGETFSILVDLGTARTRWSDGRTVQASDFIYSWKRLLDPDSRYEAASLLYDIKNAKAAKMGDVSIDDVGIAAVDTYVIQIVFESKVDLDNFFEKCAALALVPLREDVISRYGDGWAKKPTSIVTNGPYTLKEVAENGEIRLERSAYYFRSNEKVKGANGKTDKDKEPLDKYVIPFRLLNVYDVDAQAKLAAFNDGTPGTTIYFDSNLPLAERASLKDEATVNDVMGTHTYVFNTNNKLFAKAEVRRALSLALDREEIAGIVTFAKAATGYVPYKVFDVKKGSSFREEGGDVISTSANVNEAKSLLQSAGVTSGSFTLTVRNNEVDLAVAEYVKGVWESLGFKVTIDSSLGLKKNGEDACTDRFQEAYEAGEFDVIAIDMMMQSTDAFNILSQFATAYSGNGVDMASATYDLYGHISGYSSEAYNTLIDSAYAEYDLTARTAILHEAEQMLMNDMPVCPLYFLQSAYVISGELSGFKTDYTGMFDFKRVKMNDYMEKKLATDTSEEEPAPEELAAE